MNWRNTLLCAASLLLATTVQAAPDTVILVRHAERGSGHDGDPPLTGAGSARAEALARELADAGVTHVITTAYRRTRDTAAPLVARRGLAPVEIATRGGLDAHIAEVAEAVRDAEGTVLVVGHSNTVPLIIAALGGPDVTPICETSYGHLFTLTGIDSGAPQLQHSHYGATDPAPQEGCQ